MDSGRCALPSTPIQVDARGIDEVVDVLTSAAAEGLGLRCLVREPQGGRIVTGGVGGPVRIELFQDRPGLVSQVLSALVPFLRLQGVQERVTAYRCSPLFQASR